MDAYPLRRILSRQSRGAGLNQRMIAESANATRIECRWCLWQTQIA